MWTVSELISFHFDDMFHVDSELSLGTQYFKKYHTNIF